MVYVVPGAAGSPSGARAPVGAYCTMYALRTRSVTFGAVRCGVSDENTTIPPARTGAGTERRRLGEALKAEWLDVRVVERAGAVESRSHVRAAVVHGGVSDGDPAGEVGLRLDELVAVVLMPREATRLLGLLVHGLVPVEVDVRADDVPAQAKQGRVPREVGQERRLTGEVGRERDRSRFGNREATVSLFAQELVDGCFPAVELFLDRLELRSAEHPVEHDEALLIEPAHLGFVEERERSGVVFPGERGVPRMQCQRRRIGRSVESGFGAVALTALMRRTSRRAGR